MIIANLKCSVVTNFLNLVVHPLVPDVTAIVLANLCVSFIMTSQNEEAEELMRKIEKEEDRILASEPEKQLFHLCIVNLVIGTLYW